MQRWFFVPVSLLLTLFPTSLATCQQLYSDFPLNGQISAFQVNGGYSVSESFTLAAGGTAGEVSFGAWLQTGDSVAGVSWSLGSAPFGSNIASGFAGATSSLNLANTDGYNVATVSFPLPNVVLPAGTYYITLSGAVSAGANPVYWDINNAAGIDAWDSSYGHLSAGSTCFNLIGISGSCASSFQIVSTSSNVGAAPSSVAFPVQVVSTTSSAQLIAITNNGSEPATLSGIAITGANPADFAQTNNCPISPNTLAANAACTISVTFAPQAATAYSAAITVTGSSPLSIGLTGTGVTSLPAVTLSTSSISFPNQTVNVASGAQPILLTNNGPGALTIAGIALTGANSADFAQTNNCQFTPNSLAANGSCTINATFTPPGTGPWSAALAITDNGSASPQSVALSGTGVATAPQTWPNGYTWQATFTVAAGQIPSTQTNFPALISGTFADFATTGNGGRIADTCTQTVGSNSITVPCDLIFTSDAAGTMLLNSEFETYAPATGAVSVWVNVPALSNGTVIYAWYGKTSVTTLQTSPPATWSSSFEAVYHLGENVSGAGAQLNDSTANGNNATLEGPVTASQQQPGEIGGSINFEGSTWADLANTANFSFERTDSFSISGWFKAASNSAGTLLAKWAGAPDPGWALNQFNGSSNASIALILYGSDQSDYAFGQGGSITPNVWHNVVITYSGTGTVAGMQLYIDGASQTLAVNSNNLASSILNSTAAVLNGRGGGNHMSTDSMDEIRISAKGVVFSPAWVTASYNNQHSPGAFFTVATGLTNATQSITLSTPSIVFANQTVNTTSSAQTVTLTNNGSGPLTIGSISINGVNPSDFGQVSNCPASPNTLVANASCSINVTFTPQAASSYAAELTISSNASGSPQSVALSGTGVATAPQTWPNGYTWQATFTVAAGQIPGAQTNFPALISGTFADFATTGNGGRIANTCTQTVGSNSITVPCDLIFTSDAAGTMLLNSEFETYAPATGAVSVWVNVPALSNGTVIYAWYGKTSVTTLQTSPPATWSSSFEAVYHLGENVSGAGAQLNDSTANGNNATLEGPVAASQQQPGEIGGSINFEGSTWADLANTANFSFERTDSFSISGWFKAASNSAGTLLAKWAGAPDPGWALNQFNGSSNASIALILYGSDQSDYAFGQGGSITPNVWHNVVITYSGTGTVAGMQLYIDGASQPLAVNSNNLASSILNSTAAVLNGRGGGNHMSTDSMDEIRISAKGVVFSPAWVTASYNNQHSPGAFFTVATGLTNP